MIPKGTMQPASARSARSNRRMLARQSMPLTPLQQREIARLPLVDGTPLTVKRAAHPTFRQTQAARTLQRTRGITMMQLRKLPQHRHHTVELALRKLPPTLRTLHQVTLQCADRIAVALLVASQKVSAQLPNPEPQRRHHFGCFGLSRACGSSIRPAPCSLCGEQRRPESNMLTVTTLRLLLAQVMTAVRTNYRLAGRSERERLHASAALAWHAHLGVQGVIVGHAVSIVALNQYHSASSVPLCCLRAAVLRCGRCAS